MVIQQTPSANWDLTVVSFGRVGKEAPPQASYVIDVTEWRDPVGSMKLRTLYKNGLSGEVQDFVSEDPKFNAAVNAALQIAHTCCVSASTKTWISIGIRDHHGVWTAPAMAELISEEIARKLGLLVYVRHAELKHSSTARPPEKK